MIGAFEYMHPEDRAALANLENVALLPQCVKAFLKMLPETMVFGLNMANKIRLGPNQLPDIYDLLPPICDTLGITEPEFYLEMDPAPNAYTFGDTRISLTVTSGLVGSFEKPELTAVLAHECGHIACRHVLYHSMAELLFKLGTQVFGPLAAISYPVQVALFAWSRRSELSADRAAAVVSGGADTVVDTMIRLAGGPVSITGAVNVEEYLRQAEDYSKLIDQSLWNQMLQTFAVMGTDHPFCAVRAREIAAWCNTEKFNALLGASKGISMDGRCPGCGKPIENGWRFCRSCGAPLAKATE